MGGGDSDDDMGFQHRNESALNCPSSGMNTNSLPSKVSGMPMNSVSLYKSLSGADHFFGAGWDPIVSLNQGENFGVSSIVSHNEFAPSYTAPLENQGMSSASNLDQYSSDPNFVGLVPKIPCFGSGNFSDMVTSFGLPENAQIARSGCPNYVPNKGCNERTSPNVSQSYENRQMSEGAAVGVSTNGKTRKRALESSSVLNPDNSAELELQEDLSGDSGILKDQDEKKQKSEPNTGADMRGKQAAKPAKDGSQSGEAPKDYIHMRAKRGQATNSHSLAERVRREKISERMRLLQELVPGCNKITGKAVMLDEIINYVQSLQQQVEFLSMKLATVNPEVDIDIERILSKDNLHLRGGGAAIIGYSSGMNSSRPYQPGIFQGTMSNIPRANPQFRPMSQSVLDHEFQSILQMGYDSTAALDSLGPDAGHLKPQL